MNRRKFLYRVLGGAAAAALVPVAARAVSGPAPVKAADWGSPLVASQSYRSLWQVQQLRKYNEAIALDYVVPFRVLDEPINWWSYWRDQLKIPLGAANLDDMSRCQKLTETFQRAVNWMAP